MLRLVGRSQYTGVDQLWDKRYQSQVQDGDIVVVRGDPVFDPRDRFGPYFYLVDTLAKPDHRNTKSAFTWGIRIADLECQDEGSVIICQPFDPTQADAFEFRGTVHWTPAGKRPLMELSNIDFEKSRQLVDGTWQSIPLGVFEIP